MADANNNLPPTKRWRAAFVNHIKFKAKELEALELVIGKDFAVMSFLYPVDMNKAVHQLRKTVGDHGYKVKQEGISKCRVIVDNR